MAKLKLTASPTFKATVLIPVPGAKPSPVEFVFKGRSKDGFKDFMESVEGKDDVALVLEMASGWDLEDAFGEETVAQLLQSYIGAARAILDTYMREQTGARLGN